MGTMAPMRDSGHSSAPHSTCAANFMLNDQVGTIQLPPRIFGKHLEEICRDAKGNTTENAVRFARPVKLACVSFHHFRIFRIYEATSQTTMPSWGRLKAPKDDQSVMPTAC